MSMKRSRRGFSSDMVIDTGILKNKLRSCPVLLSYLEQVWDYLHDIKGFAMPTKSFVKIGIRKIVCYNNKMFSSINKTFGCCRKIFVCSNKKFISCP